jgi:hypothetical protein
VVMIMLLSSEAVGWAKIGMKATGKVGRKM